MRKTIILIAAFALAGSLWAADPIIGKWKLNVSKSTYSQVYLSLQKRQAPKEGGGEGFEVYREIAGNQLELTRSIVRQDGSGGSGIYTCPLQGGVVMVPKDYPDAIVETFVAPGEWYATFLRDGIQRFVIHKVVSKDGKTLTQTTTGVAPDGKFFEQIEVYDKQ
jgi:hypothetical protein